MRPLWYDTGTRLKLAVRLSGFIDRRPLLLRRVGLPGTHDLPQILRAATCYVGGKRRRARAEQTAADGRFRTCRGPPADYERVQLVTAEDGLMREKALFREFSGCGEPLGQVGKA